MKKYLVVISIIGVLGFAGIVTALPYFQSTQGLIPFVNDAYYIGTSSPSTLEYKGIFTKDLTVSGTCTGCGSGSGTFSWTPTSWGNSTSTILGFPGFISTASSTLSSTLNVTGLTTLGNASTTQIGSTGSAYFATASGNVGIGTTSPYSLLSISNNLNTAANTPLFTIASTTGGTSTSTLMTVLASGNVGIGTSTPIANLVVNGTTGQNLFQMATSTNQGIVTVNANGMVALGTIPATYYGRLSINVATDQNFVFRSDPFTGARIEAVNDAVSANIPMELVATRFTLTGGNVGIGTTKPWGKLAI